MGNKEGAVENYRGFATKREARILAVQCLYNIALIPEDIKSADAIISDLLAYGTTQTSVDEKYFTTLVNTTYSHIKLLHKTIQEFLANDWTISRLPETVQAILIVAVAEMLYCYDTPINVIFNEYIEIAKIFNHDGEAGFINGVLDKISKKYPRR